VRGVLIVLIKDLAELLASGRAMVLTFVFPCLFVLLVGQLHPQPMTLRLLLAGADEDNQATLSAVAAALGELTLFEVAIDRTGPVETLRRLRNGDVDLACAREEQWNCSTAITDPFRLGVLVQYFPRIKQAIIAADDWQSQNQTTAAAAGTDGPAPPAPAGQPIVLLTQLATGPQQSTPFMYFPRASERPHALLPETMALVVCILPFILACHALVREREQRTLDILLSTPRITAGTLLAGKCAAVVVVTLAVFGLMLVIVHAVYGIYVKSGILSATLLVVAPAATCAALCGLAVSAWTTSSLQAVMSSAIYLLAQSLFGGFLYPVSPGTGVVSALSLAFPLTAVHPALKAWAFGGVPDWLHATAPLLALCLIYALAARLVFRRPG